MKTLKVVDLLETPCLLAPEKGVTLLSIIVKALKSSPGITVDFDGYEFLSSAFLNHVFGQICIDEGWNVEKFHKTIKIKGLDEDDVDEVELAIDNAQTRRSLLKQGINPEQYYSSRLPA